MIRADASASSTPIPSSGVERRRVVVGLEGGRTPIGAIQVGRVIAAALGAPLHGVLVWPTGLSPSEIPRVLRLAPEALEGMVLDVEVGNPAERLRAHAEEHPVAFLVLAAEEEGCDACCLGDLAARTIEGTRASVILVRPDAARPAIRRILVPLDGTPSTAAALAPAGELARCTGAELDIVLVEQAAGEPSSEPGAMKPPQYLDQPQHEWPAFSEEFVQRFLGSIGHCPPEVKSRFFLGAGDPASEILRFSRELDADLIALVWHGDCEEHGAVFRGVVRGADRPILVLRR